MKLGIFVSIFALSIFTAMGQAWAGTNAKVMDKILSHYLKIQQQLASDSPALDTVQFEAGSISKMAAHAVAGEPDDTLTQISSSADDLSKTTTVDQAREQFKKLSAPVSQWALKAKPKGIKVWNCPMAKVDWVQAKGEMRNPFYGKDMRHCGDPK
jgi:hypothetical protein